MTATYLGWPDKGPDENLDYDTDWTAELAGDTIATSTWIVPAGLVAGAESNTTTVTTIWLSGGVVGTSYPVLNEIATSGGRVFERTIFIRVATK